MSILNGTRVVPSLHEEWSDYKVPTDCELCTQLMVCFRSTSAPSLTWTSPVTCGGWTSTVPPYTVLYCTVLYCTVLYCRYCATLAHKANHSFAPNTRWGRMEHPR